MSLRRSILKLPPGFEPRALFASDTMLFEGAVEAYAKLASELVLNGAPPSISLEAFTTTDSALAEMRAGYLRMLTCRANIEKVRFSVSEFAESDPVFWAYEILNQWLFVSAKAGELTAGAGDEDLCVVCLFRAPGGKFIGCDHGAFICCVCASKIIRDQISCPLCRAVVTGYEECPMPVKRGRSDTVAEPAKRPKKETEPRVTFNPVPREIERIEWGASPVIRFSISTAEMREIADLILRSLFNGQEMTTPP